MPSLKLYTSKLNSKFNPLLAHP